MLLGRLAIALGALLALAAPSYAINKCTNSQGQVVFQDAPCDARSAKSETIQARDGGGSDAAGWKFRRAKDDMTGRISCLVTSPVTSADPAKERVTSFQPAHLVFVIEADKTIFGVRTSTDKDSFHVDISGMGIKFDNAPFIPFDVRGGSNVVATSQPDEVLGALPKARSARLRLRFWPYETLYDTLPIDTTGFAAAFNRGRQCAEALK